MRPKKILDYDHADVFQQDGGWVTKAVSCEDTVVVPKTLKILGDLETRQGLEVAEKLVVEGDLKVSGGVNVLGDLYVFGNATFDSMVAVGGLLSVRGNLKSERRLTVGRRVFVGRNAHAKNGLRVGEEVEVGGNLQVDGWFRPQSTVEVAGELLCLDLYWPRLDMPAASEMLVCRVLPVESQAEYWRTRLDLDEEDMYGCYDDIIERLLPSLPEFLARGDLAPVERWMLESHSPANRIAYYERWEELRDAAASDAKESIDGGDGHQQEVGAGDAAPPEESGAVREVDENRL